MSDPSRFNPTGRFTGLAGTYARFRPDYPDEAVDFVLKHCRLLPKSVLVDVGCGTGISSRAFALRGIFVTGVEPNTDMLAQAESETVPAPYTPPKYLSGKAENTGLPDGFADAVLSAQAFHWFDAQKALREFNRILKPGGWCVLIWNERDESDPFTAAYGSLLRSLPDTSLVEGTRATAGEPLLSSGLFQKAERVVFHNQQILDEEGLLGRAFSCSYVPHQGPEAEALAEKLCKLFSQHQINGVVHMKYETAVYLGCRAG